MFIIMWFLLIPLCMNLEEIYLARRMVILYSHEYVVVGDQYSWWWRYIQVDDWPAAIASLVWGKNH